MDLQLQFELGIFVAKLNINFSKSIQILIIFATGFGELFDHRWTLVLTKNFTNFFLWLTKDSNVLRVRKLLLFQ